MLPAAVGLEIHQTFDHRIGGRGFESRPEARPTESRESLVDPRALPCVGPS